MRCCDTLSTESVSRVWFYFYGIKGSATYVSTESVWESSPIKASRQHMGKSSFGVCYFKQEEVNHSITQV
jgi:hypothetical protein